jgi:hypothetical protein
MILGKDNDAADARFHIRAVIADEHNERALRPAHVGKRVGFPVHASEREVLRTPREITNLGFR